MERQPQAENEPQAIERSSVIAAYMINALLNCSSVGFREDLEQSVYYANERSTWYDGKPITDDERRNIAAATVLKQLAYSFLRLEPLVLKTEVQSMPDIYSRTQAIIDAIDFTNIRQNVDKELMHTTTKRLAGQEVQSTPAMEIAVALWNRRGVVDIDMVQVEDIVEAMEATDYSMVVPQEIYIEDGMLAEAYALPETPSHTESRPFYLALFDYEEGSKWLDALLEDLVALDAEIAR